MAAEATAVPVSAMLGTGLTYEFTGADAGRAGYAEGTLSLSSATDATYHLYWSNNAGALGGYLTIYIDISKIYCIIQYYIIH